jgi:hypothetical protein
MIYKIKYLLKFQLHFLLVIKYTPLHYFSMVNNLKSKKFTQKLIIQVL